MLPGQSVLSAVELASENVHALSPYTADAIYRTPGVTPSYQVQIGWGGNLTQTQNSSGVQLASVSATNSNLGAVSNLISGSNVHYNPLTDTDSIWWGSNVLPNAATIDMSASISFNKIEVFLHPLLPTCTSFSIQTSPDNSTWTTIFQGDGLPTRVIANFNSTLTARYFRIVPGNVGSDGYFRIVALNVFNMIDESTNVSWVNGQPQITIDSKADENQNSSPTPSECDLTFQNMTGRFSPFNSSSPIYGTLQIDGRGSGVRPNCPVIVTATATAYIGGPAYTTSNIVFNGYITNDDNPGGSQAIQLDESSKTATIICKSLLARLTTSIDTPVYECASLDFIIRDICYRCGIADQQINIQSMGQGVPWLSFSNSPAQSIISDMITALPFLLAFDTYDPNSSVNFVNKGRSRIDLDLTRFINASSTIVNFVNVNALKKMIIFGSDNAVYSMSMTSPPGSGLTNIGNVTAGINNQTTIFVNGTIIYMIDPTTGNVYSWNSASTFNGFIQSGSFSATLTKSAMYGNFIYTFSYSQLYIWDTSQAFSTFRTISTATGGNTICVDGTYLIWGFGTNYYVWTHNGNPYSTSFSPSTYTPGVSLAIAGYGTNATLYLYTYLTTTPTIYSMNPATGAFTSIGSPSLDGPIQTNQFNHSGMHETYLYVGFVSESSPKTTTYLWVWDTTKSISNSMQVATLTSDFIPSSYGPMGSLNWAGSNQNEVDIYNRFWLTTAPISQNNVMTGILVEGTNYSNTGLYSFDIADNFTSKMTVSDGNPQANRIQIYSDYFSSNTAELLFSFSPTTQFSNAINVVGGTVTNWSALVSNGSRGYGGIIDGNFTNRAFVFSPNTQNITSGGTTATVSVADTTGIIDGVSQVILLGGTPEIRTVSSHSTNTSITFSAVNGTAHTSAVFANGPTTGGIIPDAPATTTNVTIGGVVYPSTFFGFSDICYLTMNATGVNGTIITSGAIYGPTVQENTDTQITIDQTDLVSKGIYGYEYILSIQSPMFNDLSMWRDIMLNFKYAKLYLYSPGLQLPFYPIINCGNVIALNDTTLGLSNQLMEVLEVKHVGFTTQVIGKAVNSYLNV